MISLSNATAKLRRHEPEGARAVGIQHVNPYPRQPRRQRIRQVRHQAGDATTAPPPAR